MLMIICTTSGNYFMITNFRNLVAKYFKHTFSLASILLGFNLGNALSRYPCPHSAPSGTSSSPRSGSSGA